MGLEYWHSLPHAISLPANDNDSSSATPKQRRGQVDAVLIDTLADR